MASNVSNAVGTAVQFNAQPQNTYKKSLTSLGNVSYSPNTSANDGVALAHALGVLGDTISAEVTDAEKRKELVGTAIGKYRAGMMTEEQLKTVNAVDYLQQTSDFDLADNPYAIAEIEKNRGRYLAARLKENYLAHVEDTNSYKNTPAEQVADYNKYMQDNLPQFMNGSSNSTAFEQGFYETHVQDQLENAHNQIKWHSAALKTEALSTTSALLGDIVSKQGLNDTPENVLTGFNKVLLNSRFGSLTPAERIEVVKHSLDELAVTTGRGDTLEHLKNNLVLGVGINGKEYKAGDVIDFNPLNLKASLRGGQLHDTKVTTFLDDAQQSKSIPELRAKFAHVREADPSLFYAVVGHQEVLENNLKRTIATAQRQQINALAHAGISTQVTNALNAHYRAYYANMPMVGAGQNTANTLSELPKIKYKELESGGAMVEKEHTITQEEANEWFANQYAYIRASSSDITSRSNNVLRLLSWGVAKPFRDSLKSTMQTALDTLSADRIQVDEQGRFTGSENVQLLMDTYKTNPNAFQSIFGEDLTKHAQIIETLTNAYGGDYKQGMMSYVMGRDLERTDPTHFKKLRSDLDTEIKNNPLKGFTSISGEKVTLNKDIGPNSELASQILTSAQWMAASGLNPKTALEKATQNARDSYYIWNGTALPRGIFNDLAVAAGSTDRAGVAKRVMDGYLQHVLKDNNIDPNYLTVRWNNELRQLEFYSPAANFFYARPGYMIANDGLYMLQTDQERQQNTTAEYIQNERARQNNFNDLHNWHTDHERTPGHIPTPEEKAAQQEVLNGHRPSEK